LLNRTESLVWSSQNIQKNQTKPDCGITTYEALNDHYKENTRKWLKEDNAAQRDWNTFPASMDIYDNIKEKGAHNPWAY
jgi:hypothetical protein